MWWTSTEAEGSIKMRYMMTTSLSKERTWGLRSSQITWWTLASKTLPGIHISTRPHQANMAIHMLILVAKIRTIPQHMAESNANHKEIVLIIMEDCQSRYSQELLQITQMIHTISLSKEPKRPDITMESKREIDLLPRSILRTKLTNFTPGIFCRQRGR